MVAHVAGVRGDATHQAPKVQAPPAGLKVRGDATLQTPAFTGVAPSVLLAKLADSDNTSTSDDDDEGRVYEAKFAELFDALCTVPNVKAYVSIVRTYSDKVVELKVRLYQEWLLRVQF
ncbi:hypothetical protein HPB47_008674 [Ixodes persulcatus]|uniref:Uncharacterized protein n=1 Tax=Ixodes persulcatus TaxID=34615 RepID=A0AC60P446_IXOPE|nr:hypothetical protein HPB47_008674 [Ixodes persulcatus]